MSVKYSSLLLLDAVRWETRHNMMLAASLLTLVAMTTAAWSGTPPTKCCVPDKLEMSIVEPQKWGSGDLEVIRVSMDTSTKKEAYVISAVVPGQPPVHKSRMVIDYNLHKRYFITQPNNLCQTADFTEPFTTCYPDDAAVLDRSYVGDMSVGETYSAISFQVAMANYTVMVDKNCVPIVQVIKGRVGGFDVDLTQLISGFKAGNSDPTVYDVPSTCH